MQEIKFQMANKTFLALHKNCHFSRNSAESGCEISENEEMQLFLICFSPKSNSQTSTASQFHKKYLFLVRTQKQIRKNTTQPDAQDAHVAFLLILCLSGC
jgi:hypothetical protein